MINSALTFLANFLNQQLKLQHGIEDSVVASNLTDSDGSTPAQIKNKLAVSVANIEQENVTRSMQNVMSGQYQRQSPPLHINLVVLISANFDSNQYSEGLELVSNVMRIMESHRSFDRQSHPELPDNLEKLNCDMVNLSLSESAILWTGLKASQRPALLYKLRILQIPSDSSEDDRPSIAEASKPAV